jgi:hypothetical protein
MLSWLIGCNYDRGGFISQGKKKKKKIYAYFGYCGTCKMSPKIHKKEKIAHKDTI